MGRSHVRPIRNVPQALRKLRADRSGARFCAHGPGMCGGVCGLSAGKQSQRRWPKGTDCRAVLKANSGRDEGHEGKNHRRGGTARFKENATKTVRAHSEGQPVALRPDASADQNVTTEGGVLRITDVADDTEDRELESAEDDRHVGTRAGRRTRPHSLVCARPEGRQSRGEAEADMSHHPTGGVHRARHGVVQDEIERGPIGKMFRGTGYLADPVGFREARGQAEKPAAAPALHALLNQEGCPATSGSSGFPIGEDRCPVGTSPFVNAVDIHRVILEPTGAKCVPGLKSVGGSAEGTCTRGVAHTTTTTTGGGNQIQSRGIYADHTAESPGVISADTTGSHSTGGYDSDSDTKAYKVAGTNFANAVSDHDIAERTTTQRGRERGGGPRDNGRTGGVDRVPPSSIADPGIDQEGSRVQLMIHQDKKAWKLLEAELRYEERGWYSLGKMRCRRVQKGRREDRHSDWPLDLPDVGGLDYPALRALANEEHNQEVLQVVAKVQDPEVFEALFEERGTIPCVATSSDFETETSRLLQLGYITPIARSKVKGFVHGFTVPKVKKSTRRTILDGRPLNKLQCPPPRTALPNLDDIAQCIRRYAFGCELDGTGWFHQFTLHPDIAAFWVLRLGKQRFSWNRMPMGWTHAVHVAHTVAQFLANFETDIPGRILVYIDNVYVFADTPQQVEALRDQFLQRCKQVAAIFSESSPVGSELQVLGVNVNLRTKTMSLPDSFLRKLDLLLACFDDIWWEQGTASEKPTTLLLWKIFGHVTWASRVLGIRLCGYPHWVAWLSRRARQLYTSPNLWDAPCAIWPSARTELHTLLTVIRCNQPRTVRHATPTTHHVWTDASNWGWGVVHDSDFFVDVTHHQWSERMRQHTIAHRELYAVTTGIAQACARLPPFTECILHCDNTNVLSWIRKWKGPTPFVNHQLTQLATTLTERQCTLTAHYVESTQNLADRPSRGDP